MKSLRCYPASRNHLIGNQGHCLGSFSLGHLEAYFQAARPNHFQANLQFSAT